MFFVRKTPEERTQILLDTLQKRGAEGLSATDIAYFLSQDYQLKVHYNTIQMEMFKLFVDDKIVCKWGLGDNEHPVIRAFPKQ